VGGVGWNRATLLKTAHFNNLDVAQLPPFRSAGPARCRLSLKFSYSPSLTSLSVQPDTSAVLRMISQAHSFTLQPCLAAALAASQAAFRSAMGAAAPTLPLAAAATPGSASPVQGSEKYQLITFYEAIVCCLIITASVFMLHKPRLEPQPFGFHTTSTVPNEASLNSCQHSPTKQPRP